jgi:hypothetical protein
LRNLAKTNNRSDKRFKYIAVAGFTDDLKVFIAYQVSLSALLVMVRATCSNAEAGVPDGKINDFRGASE